MSPFPSPPGDVDRALFIIGAPRSGTTILQRALALHEDLWSVLPEAREVFEGPFRPDLAAGGSNRVTAERLDAVLGAELRARLRSAAVPAATAVGAGALVPSERSWSRLRLRLLVARARRRQAHGRPVAVRVLVKSPRNSLRVPMLAALVPDSRFIVVLREPAATIDSLITGWQTFEGPWPMRRPRYRSYRVGRAFVPAGYPAAWWSFALVPDWRCLAGQPLSAVAAEQFCACTLAAARDLALLPAERRYVLRYEDFTANPVGEVARILAWAGLPASRGVEDFARLHVGPARRHLRHGDAVAAVRARWEAAAHEAYELLGIR